MPGRQEGPRKTSALQAGKMMNEPRPPARRAGHRGLFNTVMGPLQRQLRSGEYNLFRCATLFESDFVQVSKRGGTLDVHNQVQLVRVAIAATSPRLRVPNVLLLARPVFPPEQQLQTRQARLRHSTANMKFELTRLLPLCFVKISIHDLEKQQLRFKMATGRTFYLQLCPQLDRRAGNFDSWVKVVHLLRPPLEAAQAQQEQPGGEPALCTAESPVLQSAEERECSVADVLSILQEEAPGEQRIPAQLSESLNSIPGPMPSPEEPPEWDSPPPSEGQASKELLPSSRDSKAGKHKDRSSSSRKRSTRSKSRKSRRSHSSKRGKDVGRGSPITPPRTQRGRPTSTSSPAAHLYM
ncbi:protein FAM71B-like [Varanus komodoensis]|uniref:protein FAM71B-like n=1 Tax=Varanus komodoensis TaxID=61221 RepID=UPI001CF7D3F0|nr:protein FAM71B-like [Varanus komodoensis]